MIRLLALSLVWLAPASDFSRAAPREERVAIKAGRILTMGGREIPNGIILIEAGKIRKVGEGVEIPAGARILDFSDKVVMPGLIDANSSVGIAGQSNEDGSEVTPHVRILDAVDPRSRELARVRQSGVTTVFVGPGNRNVIGGLGAVIKTVGASRAEMAIREDAALKGAMGSGPSAGNFSPRGTTATFYARRPTTRMGVAWEFRKAFIDARRAREGGLAGDEGKEILLRAMEGKLPVRVSASRATDIETALRLAEEIGIAIILEEAQEAYKMAVPLAQRKIPVLLRPGFSAASSPGPEGSDLKLDAFTVLRAAGVDVALLPAAEEESESLLTVAAFAVRYGARREDALRAITIVPAEILGVSRRVGSIEEGKDADLVVLSGDPLDVKSRVEAVLIDGKVVFDGRSGR